MAEVIAEFEVSTNARQRDEAGRFKAGLDAAEIDGAFEVGKHIANEAAAVCWHHSLPIEVIGGGGGLVEVEALGPHAALEHEGSPPHPIDREDGPLANKAEDFFAPSGHVDHPGFAGDHFLENAGDSSFGYGLALVSSLLP
jgi:hypothetical protein